MAYHGDRSKNANSVQLCLVEQKKNSRAKRITAVGQPLPVLMKGLSHEDCSLGSLSETGPIGDKSQGGTVLHTHGFPSKHGNFSIAFLCCWKYLATELNSTCCKRHSSTRKKVQSTDRTVTLTPEG